jgi:trigger factor
MPSDTSDAAVLTDNAAEGGDETKRLDLNVQIKPVSACQRHVTVTIARADIDRYFEKAFSKLVPEAQVPGFRVGRAPRKLVEARFKKDVSQQVRGELLLDSVSQVSEDNKLAAISEPDFDPLAIEIPDEGPMTFEFDLEVRPEFDVPNWKGLKIERQKHEFTPAEIETRLKDLLAEYGQRVPKDGAAEVGDYVGVDITVKHSDAKHGDAKQGDQIVNTIEEEFVRILPALSFRDGGVKGFDKLMAGVNPGDVREAKFRLTRDAANEALRGQEVTAEFKVLEVRRLELPELTHSLLSEFNVDNEEELRGAVKTSLERQLQYQADRRLREQITAALVESANWELPPDLLRRQATRELQRAILELRRGGFSDAEIRARENELRQNSAAETARALKEHFILERIAEEEKIEDAPDDYDHEISLIAFQLGESARKVRARLEKAGQMDVLRNQIIERKVIDKIIEHANFKDVPYTPPRPQVEALDRSAAGGDKEKEIPEAHEEGTAEAEGGQEEATG